MNEDWLKRIIAPVIVAVVVGMSTSYLSTAVAMARMDEKTREQSSQMEKHDARIKALEDARINVAVLDAEMKGMRTQLNRIEGKLDKMGTHP